MLETKHSSPQKTLFTNFSALVSVQIANYALPLLTLPYLARVIGVGKFGTIFFAQALVAYFLIVTNFGFNFYAPKEIAVVRDDQEKLGQTFWTIFITQALLCAVSFLIFAGLVLTVSRFRSESALFFMTFGSVIGNVFYPVWFFQGIERMTFTAIFNFIIRIFYTLSIFVFIKKETDYLLVPLVSSSIQILVGFGIIFVIISRFRLKPVIPSPRMISITLRRSFILFVSNVSIGIYSKINPVLLGLFSGDIFVGYYSAAEKLFLAWMGVQSQLGAVFYPHIAKVSKESGQERTLMLVRKALILTMALAIPVTLCFLVFSDSIIRVFYGQAFSKSAAVLRIISFLFIIIGLSNIFGIQTMLPLEMKKEFVIPVVTAGAVNLLVGFLLIPRYKHIGAALTFLVSEIWVAAAMFLYLKRKGISVFENIGASGKSLVKSLWHPPSLDK